MTFLLVSFMAWVLREDIFTHISAIRVFQMAARCPPQLSDIVRSPRTYRTILRSMGEEIDPFFHSNELPPSFTTRKVKRKNSSLSLQKMGSFLFSRRCSYRLPAPPVAGTWRESCNRRPKEIRSMDQSGRGLRVSLVAAGRA